MGQMLITRRVAMRNRAVYTLVAGMLSLAGCGKSNNNSMQSATPQQAPAATPSNQTATPQQSVEQTPAAPAQGQAPVQAPTQEQAQAANPANAQTQAPEPPPEPPAPLVVPAGATLPVILATSISSYKNKAGEELEGNRERPMLLRGELPHPKHPKTSSPHRN